MGFVLQRKQFKLTFGAGTELDGASIVIGSFSIAEAETLDASTDDPSQINAVVDAKLQLVADRLVSWDLEDEQGPIPTTLEGLKRLDFGVVLQIQQAWAAAASAVAAPLPSASSGGETPQPLEVSIPTETLPTSLESLPTPSS
ncbi:hypothetical protein ABH931_006159 [Streptacidiphilus sp. MAP12-33]|uniref:hypothetical protein n=1 Tax=Streptacidiphilus sp. MAP12-33 TaxID=3156266 RepID=UPI003515B14E